MRILKDKILVSDNFIISYNNDTQEINILVNEAGYDISSGANKTINFVSKELLHNGKPLTTIVSDTNNVIGSDNIKDDTILHRHMTDNSVGTEEIIDHSVTIDKLSEDIKIPSTNLDIDINELKVKAVNIIGDIPASKMTAGVISAINDSTGIINKERIAYLSVDHIKDIVIQAINSVELQTAKINAAHIGELSAEMITSGDINTNRLVANIIKAVNLSVEDAKIDQAKIGDLSADKIKSGTIDAKIIDVKNLNASNIVAGKISSDVNIFNDGYITSAMIKDLSVDKLLSGTIDTNKINVVSSDGGFSIRGNTTQWTDANGAVRLQAGRDAQGNFNFSIFGPEGKSLLIDENGIHKDAIPDNIIVNDMVADNANINASKLNISSLFSKINEDKSHTLNSSKIWVDTTNQSLGTTLTSMTTSIDNLETKTTSLTEDLKKYDKVSKDAIKDLVSKIDNKIVNWFYDYDPTLHNEPAVNWTDYDTRNLHIGDLFINTSTGKVFRFYESSPRVHTWQDVTNKDISKALTEASKAQDTADHKRRVFTSTTVPTPPYDKGDLWVQGGSGDILVSVVNKPESSTPLLNDWSKASKYTDNSELDKFKVSVQQDFVNKTIYNDYINQTSTTLKDIQASLDSAITNWFYDYDPEVNKLPSLEWNTKVEKDTHLGDIFYNTKTGKCFRWLKSSEGVYDWQKIDDSDIALALQNASRAQDTADHKRRVFTTNSLPTPPYDEGDLWVQGNGGDILYCTTHKLADQANSLTDWTKASKYTDDSTFQDFKSTIYKTFTEVTNQSITSQVEKTKKLDKRMTDAEGNIKTVSQSVSENKSSITQLNDSISTKVSQTEYYNYTDQLNNKLKHINDTLTPKSEVIVGVQVKYAINSSNISIPSSTSWSDTQPKWENGKYIWQKVVTQYADGTSRESTPACITGAKGTTGDSSYTYIRYSALPNPTTPADMSTSPNTYIGILVSNLSTPSNDPNDYVWSKFRGTDGIDGTKVLTAKFSTPIEITKDKFDEYKILNKTTTWSNFENYNEYSVGDTAIVPLTVIDEFNSKLNASLTIKVVAKDNTTISGTTVSSIIDGRDGLTGQSGINFLINSNFSKGKTNWSVSSSSDSFELFESKHCINLNLSNTITITQLVDTNKIKPKTAYTYSVYTHLGDMIKNSNFMLDINNSGIRGIQPITPRVIRSKLIDDFSSSEWQRLEVTFIFDTDMISFANVVRSSIQISGATGNIRLADFKLEEGDHATNWTPAPEDINGIVSIKTQYYLSTSDTSQVDGTWSTIQPTWESGKYYWIRSEVLWTDNSITFTDPVLAVSLNTLHKDSLDTSHQIGNLNEIITRVNTSVDQLSDKIMSKVQAEYIAKPTYVLGPDGKEILSPNSNELIKAISSQITQDTSSWRAEFSESINNLNNSTSDNTKNINTIRSRVIIDKNGIELSADNSVNSLKLTKDKIQMINNGVPVSTWEGGVMNVEQLIALSSIKVGNHLIEKYKSDEASVGNGTIIRMVK